MEFILNHQIFKELFAIFFSSSIFFKTSQLLELFIERLVSCIAVAKVVTFLELANIFASFLQYFLRKNVNSLIINLRNYNPLES